MPTEHAPSSAPASNEPRAYFLDSYLHPGTDRFHQYQLRAKDSPNHCGPFSTAMAVNMLVEKDELQGEQVAGTLTKEFVGWYPRRSLLPRVNRFPPKAFTFPGAIEMYLQRNGYDAKARVNGSLGQLRACLLNGHLAAVLHGEPMRFKGIRWQGWSHWKLIVGFTPTTFLYQDPWLELPDPASGPIAEFDRLWANMGRAWVHIRGKAHG